MSQARVLATINFPSLEKKINDFCQSSKNSKEQDDEINQQLSDILKSIFSVDKSVLAESAIVEEAIINHIGNLAPLDSPLRPLLSKLIIDKHSAWTRFSRDKAYFHYVNMGLPQAQALKSLLRSRRPIPGNKMMPMPSINIQYKPLPQAYKTHLMSEPSVNTEKAISPFTSGYQVILEMEDFMRILKEIYIKKWKLTVSPNIIITSELKATPVSIRPKVSSSHLSSSKNTRHVKSQHQQRVPNPVSQRSCLTDVSISSSEKKNKRDNKRSCSTGVSVSSSEEVRDNARSRCVRL